jgi:ribosome-binding factor A
MTRGGRDRRIGQEMQRLLPELIRGEVKDPRVVGIVTITGVDVSADLAHARVFVTVLNGGDEVQATVDALNRSASFLRSRLSQMMTVRTVPALKFVFDASVERGVQLSRLIESAIENERKDDDPSRGPDQ